MLVGRILELRQVEPFVHRGMELGGDVGKLFDERHVGVTGAGLWGREGKKGKSTRRSVVERCVDIAAS